jgi:serine/threonine protein phosphatase PrpC
LISPPFVAYNGSLKEFLDMSVDSEVIAWVFGCTDVGRVRKNNEDAFVIADLTANAAAGSMAPAGAPVAASDTTERGAEGMLRKCRLGAEGLLLAVSDGMGGAEAGEIASHLVVESLREDLVANRERSTGGLVRSAVERANNVVFGAAGQHPKRGGMGATLTAAFVREDRAYVAGVGDSRCYVIRGKRIRQVTRDQSLVESLVELGHLTREEAETSPHRNVILQALGTRPEVAVALTRLQLYRGDMLLLCSDGLSGKISAEEMLALALAGPTLDEGCRKMVALAKDRGGEDNITVILSHFSGAGLGQPVEAQSVTGTLEKIHGFNHASGVGYEGDAPRPAPDAEAASKTIPLLPPPPGKES